MRYRLMQLGQIFAMDPGPQVLVGNARYPRQALSTWLRLPCLPRRRRYLKPGHTRRKQLRTITSKYHAPLRLVNAMQKLTSDIGLRNPWKTRVSQRWTAR